MSWFIESRNVRRSMCWIFMFTHWRINRQTCTRCVYKWSFLIQRQGHHRPVLCNAAFSPWHTRCFHSLPRWLAAPCARYAGRGSICLANGAKRVGRVWSAKALSLFVCCLNGQGWFWHPASNSSCPHRCHKRTILTHTHTMLALKHQVPQYSKLCAPTYCTLQ